MTDLRAINDWQACDAVERRSWAHLQEPTGGPTCLQTLAFSNGREAASGYWGGISEQYQWPDFFWA